MYYQDRWAWVKSLLVWQAASEGKWCPPLYNAWSRQVGATGQQLSQELRHCKACWQDTGCCVAPAWTLAPLNSSAARPIANCPETACQSDAIKNSLIDFVFLYSTCCRPHLVWRSVEMLHGYIQKSCFNVADVFLFIHLYDDDTYVMLQFHWFYNHSNITVLLVCWHILHIHINYNSVETATCCQLQSQIWILTWLSDELSLKQSNLWWLSEGVTYRPVSVRRKTWYQTNVH